jgi:hypothetical protein
MMAARFAALDRGEGEREESEGMEGERDPEDVFSFGKNTGSLVGEGTVLVGEDEGSGWFTYK